MHSGEKALGWDTQFSLMVASTVFALMGTSVYFALTDAMSLKILRSDHLPLGNRVARAKNRTTYGWPTTCRWRQHAMVCPKLLSFVKEDVSRDAELLKSLRKAREERDAARKVGGKKGD